MSNIIIIKHGPTTPTTDNLQNYELGYKENGGGLFINDNGTIRAIGANNGGGEGGNCDCVQADWDQTDETAIDFIKNKPDEEDALRLLFELGFVIMLVDENDFVFTDENGVAFTV